jgi:hypothetical protein
MPSVFDVGHLAEESDAHSFQGFRGLDGVDGVVEWYAHVHVGNV